MEKCTLPPLMGSNLFMLIQQALKATYIILKGKSSKILPVNLAFSDQPVQQLYYYLKYNLRFIDFFLGNNLITKYYFEYISKPNFLIDLIIIINLFLSCDLPLGLLDWDRGRCAAAEDALHQKPWTKDPKS